MFADIMGYTALMEEDEGNALKLRDKFKIKLESEVGRHYGKVVKISGDGALCCFDSAAESVRAAISIQKNMREDVRVPLRIGIHQADVIFEESDVHGDGVNIASRLESIAVPGSIFISAKVYDDVKNQKDIQVVSLGKYLLKNVKEPVEIFAVSNEGLEVPLKKKLEGKAKKYVAYSKTSRGLLLKYAKMTLLILIIVMGAFFLINPWLKKQNARATLLPAIQKLVSDNFRPPTEAFDLALRARNYIPDDSLFKALWPVVTKTVSMETQPEGAEVFWKDYDKPESQWRPAGITPLKDNPFPRSYLRIEIRKKGYQTIEYAAPGLFAPMNPYVSLFKLDPVGSLPENMVRIPKRKTLMNLIGLESYGPRSVDEFLMDKYEVTNAKFKAFVDAGGYTNKAYWKFPIYSNDGSVISQQSALALFIDRTGRRGPATWEAGNYPDGQEYYPVTGVSWYEAAAYAAFAGKELPTVFHWSVIAETSRTDFIVPMSNFNGKGSTPVGTMPGYNTFGIYDVAGNAREWCFNSTNDISQRFILGGGWNDPTYAFNDSYTQNALDRSVTNGFRCMKRLSGDTSTEKMRVPLSVEFRDYAKEKPVDDKTFDIFLRQYAYDKTPLNARIDSVVENELWTCQKISCTAAYNNEKLIIFLYLPKTGKPPFQTILFFGGSGDIYSNKFEIVDQVAKVDFLVKSGRAVVCPVYKGTNERRDDLNSDNQVETVFYKDHVIMWRKDIGRTIDYLETRSDIDATRIGYLGWSWGGFLGGIMPAVEKRIKAVVLNVGGMDMGKALPEADQINFLPRVTQPILMLNGEHDMFFPQKTSQQPMFNFLGTREPDKKILVYKSGHLVPRIEFVKETLTWFDKYLGEVP